MKKKSKLHRQGFELGVEYPIIYSEHLSKRANQRGITYEEIQI